MLLTYGLVHLLSDSLQASGLLLRLTSLGYIPQQQGVASEPLQRCHQQVAQLQPPALLVPLTPLKLRGGREERGGKKEGGHKGKRAGHGVFLEQRRQGGGGRWWWGGTVKGTRRPKYNKSFNKYITMMTGKVTPGTNGHIPVFASLGDTA